MAVVPDPYLPANNENAGELEAAIEQAETRISQNYATKRDRSQSRIIRHLCVEHSESSRIEPRLLRIIAFMAAKLVLHNETWHSVYSVARAVALNPFDAAELLELRRVTAALVVHSVLECADNEMNAGAVSLSKNALSLILGGSKCIADLSPANIKALRQWREDQRVISQQPKSGKPNGPANQAGQAGQAVDTNNIPWNAASPKAIYEHLKSIIIGQDDACRVLAVRGWLHVKRMELLKAGGTAGRNECLFLAGPSGTGKTYLTETFGKCFGLPFCSFTSTDATSVGYVGLDICEDSLKALMRSTGEGNAKDAAAKARYGILFMDEWTKKAGKQNDVYGRDVSGSAVQTEILKAMEGSKVILGARRAERDSVTLEFDTNGTLFVFAGFMASFDQVVKRLKRRKSGLGFSSLHGGIGRDAYVFDALIDYGFIPEWVNRLSGVAFFNQLQKSDLVTIASLPDGPVAGYNAVLKTQGLNIQIDDDGIGEMADLCIETGLMARGLRLIAGALVEEAVFDGRKGAVVFGREHVRHAIECVSSLDDKASVG